MFLQKTAGTIDVHPETEVAVYLKSGETSIPYDQALEHVYGDVRYLDMTLSMEGLGTLQVTVT